MDYTWLVESKPDKILMETSSEAQIKPIGLAHQVRDWIQNQILSTALRPGDRIVEQKIAKHLGVGQNAVREALIQLAHLGFVQRIPNKGTYVTRIGLLEAKKIFEVRGVLETLAVNLIAKRRRSERLELSSIETLARGMLEAATAGDLPTYHKYDIQYHRALWKLADNEFLSQHLEQLVIPLFASFLVISIGRVTSGQMFIEGAKGHLDVVEALKNGSGEQAAEALQRLLDLTFEQRRLVLSKDGGPAST